MWTGFAQVMLQVSRISRSRGATSTTSTSLRKLRRQHKSASEDLSFDSTVLRCVYNFHPHSKLVCIKKPLYYCVCHLLMLSFDTPCSHLFFHSYLPFVFFCPFTVCMSGGRVFLESSTSHEELIAYSESTNIGQRRFSCHFCSI